MTYVEPKSSSTHHHHHHHQQQEQSASLKPTPSNKSLPSASSSSTYCTQLIHRIIAICSRDTYINISDDFEWYVDILARIVRVTGGVNVGQAACDQLMDIVVRVPELRDYAATVMVKQN